MTVSPVRVELSGDPGTTVGSSFKVTNEEKEIKTLYTAFENFEALGESGSPSFKVGNEGLASWLNAPKSIEVQPGETKTIDYSVTIPAGTEPGGYFAAIFLGTQPPASNPTEVSIGSRIGTLLLFRVNGNIAENGNLLEFSTKNKQVWFNALPINFFYRFQNSGNDRILPKGSITVKNMIGRSTRVLDANPGEGNILPKSIRRFEVWWPLKNSTDIIPKPQPENQRFFEAVSYQWHNFAFGRYKAVLSLNYGSKDETVASHFVIYIFPWQLLLIELLVIIIGFFLLRFILKRYNSWVIQRARRS